jgi:hypothetical protein
VTSISVYATGTASIYGGVLNGDLNAAPGGTIDLLDGSVTGSLLTGGNGTIVIHGSDFNMPLGSVQPLMGSLTGKLADGTPLSVTFNRNVRGNGNILLVPEPSTLVLLILASLGLAPFTQRNREVVTRP